MLERLQSALKTVKDCKPPSLMSHRFVTVRRGSPAARSGLIQPGDELETVEGRSVGGLQHRDLATILRRAGNILRLSITPRRTLSSPEGAELDTNGRIMKGSRGRSKDESRFYSVDLERGPTGFGFSLRGGSEYNMGLYVLGLMEGGPAQRSNKIQVSDQLVEINGDSTSGMTHSQAVEQIRRGGTRIHLILKKGNGYVPDYGPDEGPLSPTSSSSYRHTQTTALKMTTAAKPSMPPASSSSQQRGAASGERKGESAPPTSTKRRTRKRVERSVPGPADLDLDQVEREETHRRSVSKTSRKLEKLERSEKIEKSEKFEDQRIQGRTSRSLPRIGAPSWASSRPEERVEEAVPQKKPFSFLMPMDDNNDDDFDDEIRNLSDSESATSFSEMSQSAASIAIAPGGKQASDWRRDSDAPGPWLKPSPRRLTQTLSGSRFVGGLSV